MHRLKRIIIVWLCCATAFVAFAERESKKVPLAQVPAAAQKTIQKQLGAGTLGEITRVEDDGEVTYEVAWTKNGEDRDMAVAVDGTLLSIEVALDETPDAVQKSIKKQVSQGTLDSIEKTFEDGTVTYDVEMTTKAGLDRSFTVAADGKIIREQLALEEIPANVRKTIDEQAGKRKLGTIFRRLDDGEVYYDVEIIEGGNERDFSVLANGKLGTEQVFLAETPPPVRKTIQGKIGDGKIVRIDKTFDEQNDFTYEIQGRKDGKPFDFSVGPKGRFLGRNE